MGKNFKLPDAKEAVFDAMKTFVAKDEDIHIPRHWKLFKTKEEENKNFELDLEYKTLVPQEDNPLDFKEIKQYFTSENGPLVKKNFQLKSLKRNEDNASLAFYKYKSM